LLKYVSLISLIAIVIWAFSGAEVSLFNMFKGVPNIIDYLGRMIPPSGSVLSKLGKPLIETFQIAISAIILAIVIALPVSFLAARNVMQNNVVYQLTRSILGGLRGIPPLLYALLFVTMVGLGPFAGVLALTLHDIGALGRLFSEAVENINPEIMNVAKATGANKVKAVVHTVIPELSALILGYILCYFEYNVRSATVLGLVGAGGIGLQLMTSIHLFKYGEVATIMLVLLAIIIIMDRFSVEVRGSLIKGGAII